MFRYRFPCRHTELKPSEKFELDESYKLRCFGQFEGQKRFADLRAAWNDAGLFVTVEVTGKQQSVWCRENQLLASDGLQLWIDTRDTQNVHRATKFCHWFAILPAGSRDGGPLVSMLKINRSKADSPTLNRAKIKLTSEVRQDGYFLSAFFPAATLHGWNASDQRQIGFSYAVVDRELGWQTLASGPELPIMEDPALWHSMQLID